VVLYWGSALMQAEMKFEDGTAAIAFVYAPMFPPPIPADGAAPPTTGKFQ
jgi:hypothetical protein